MGMGMGMGWGWGADGGSGEGLVVVDDDDDDDRQVGAEEDGRGTDGGQTDRLTSGLPCLPCSTADR
jgi:hypothetical protein